MPGRTLHVISHTHWDREWYLTFQQFRMRLVDLIDNLLYILDNDPDFKYFSMDGQTIVLEDYLQIRPEKRAVLEQYIREGRIIIGPWYQLNDEFLVSGESTIRSLLVGHRLAQEFGPVMKVGYLPDQFGNISQMPQILNSFGIDNAIFGRGLQLEGDRKMEFWWESPDGSRVLASLMAYWYNNAQHFPNDTQEAIQYTLRLRDMMKDISHTGQLLLMNGVDHLEAQPDVGDIIKRVNEKLEEDEIVHSTLPAYIDAIKKSIQESGAQLGVIRGEMREDRGGNVLAGTLSTRIYLKQANEASQTALEKYAEPAASFAYTLGKQYPQGFLRYAWKLLMQNHPHDSICGCSIDQVHREMMPRFDQVRQIASELTDRALSAVANNIKTDADSLVIFNPLNWTRTDKVHATIDFEIGDPTRTVPTVDPARDVAAIRLVDTDGNEVPYALISTTRTGKQILDPHQLPLEVMVRRFEIEFVAENVPACGYKTYKIEKCAATQATHASPASEAYWDNALTNEYLRLSIQSGMVSLERIGTSEEPYGEVYANINTFEDVGDVGDEYLYVRPANNITITSLDARPRVSIIDRGPISATFKLDLNLKLPAKAEPNGASRSETMVDCPITTYLTVTRGIPRVDIRTVVKNAAKDHRLRVLFPNGIESDVSVAEGQFDVVTRPVGAPEEWPGAAPFYPQQRWMDVSDGSRGLCIINKGMPEYEVYTDDARTIALTLLRCVGRLSGGAEAPGANPTPEAQCIGEYTFEYAVYPHAGDWQDAKVWMQAHEHNIPMLAVQTGAHEGDLPAELSFVETSGPELVISAIKKAEDSDMLVVRFYNTTEADIPGGWIKVRGSKSAKMLNMNEEVTGDVTFADETVTLDIPAKKIVTLGFELA